MSKISLKDIFKVRDKGSSLPWLFYLSYKLTTEISSHGNKERNTTFWFPRSSCQNKFRIEGSFFKDYHERSTE